MVEWHHQINGHEFEQAWRDSEGWGAWHASVHGVSKSQTQLSTAQLLSKGASHILGTVKSTVYLLIQSHV